MTPQERQQKASGILFAIESVALRDPDAPELEQLIDQARALGADTCDALRAMTKAPAPDVTFGSVTKWHKSQVDGLGPNGRAETLQQRDARHADLIAAMTEERERRTAAR